MKKLAHLLLSALVVVAICIPTDLSLAASQNDGIESEVLNGTDGGAGQTAVRSVAKEETSFAMQNDQTVAQKNEETGDQDAVREVDQTAIEDSAAAQQQGDESDNSAVAFCAIRSQKSLPQR